MKIVKMKLKLPHLDLSLIFDAHIFCCFSEKDWPKLCPEFDISWLDENSVGSCIRKSNFILIIVNLENIYHIDESNIIDTISHEACHAVHRIHDIIGDKYPSEEVSSILSGRITAFVYSEYLKMKGKL